jgi:tRNA threonylcarbamoyladenosine biosynthesis protein TsaE
VPTVSQPGEQAGLRLRKVDTGHPDLGESERPRPLPHILQQERTIDLTAIDHQPPIVGSGVHGVWRGEEDTRAFAQALAVRPRIGEAFIALDGELGAGKTTFVRHLLRALGVEGRIKSPTYAVVEPHEGRDGLQAWHFDFYRFDDPREWEDAGFRDIFAGPGLKLAEWPQKAAAVLPTADLALAITVREDGTREVAVRPQTALGQELLA